MAGLFDFLNSGGNGGGLLDFLRSLQQPQQDSFSGLPSDQAQYGAAPQVSQPMDAMARMPSRRSAPVPLPEMPPQAPAPQQQPAPQMQSAPPPSGGNFLGNLSSAFQSIGNGGGLISALSGRPNDPQSIALQNQSAQFRAFQAAGLTPAQAMIAISHPKIAEELMKKLTPTYSAHNVGNTATVFNPATGEMRPVYTDPKYEKLGPGDNLISVGAGGKTNTIASGGPEKPPAGFRWVDNDPSKGMEAIPGGPGTHLPSETAGRMAMMEVGAQALPKAREVLMKDRGALGLFGLRATGNPGIQSVTGTGELGRAERSIRVAIEGALRAMSGANAPPAEVESYRDMFSPKPQDSVETATQKLNNLDDFIAKARQFVNQGRGPAGNAPAGGPPSDPLNIRKR